MHRNIVKYGYTSFRIKVFPNSACLLTQTWIGLNKPREIKNRLTLGVWGRVLVASLTITCAMRGDRDSNSGPSGHRR